jgi:hypothetical protein
MAKSKENIKLRDLETEQRGSEINFTDDFWLLMNDLSDLDLEKAKVSDKTKKTLDNCNEICELIYNLHQNDKLNNYINLKTLDVASKPDYFDVILGDKPGFIGVADLIKYYLSKEPVLGTTCPRLKSLTEKQLGEVLGDFLTYYNRWITKKELLPSKTSKPKTTSTDMSGFDDEYYDDMYGSSERPYAGGRASTGKPTSGYSSGYGSGYGGGYGGYGKNYYISRGEPVTVRPFKYDPTDVRSTFLSLTTETYPHGHEEEVMKYLPVPGLKKDQWGNYYLVIGRSDTMFTSHIDTASRTKGPVRVLSYTENGDEIFVTDGTSILGADDKAGVAILLYMIANNIPGVYYFFIGEERGAVGSSQVATHFDTIEHLRGMKKCVSFDRRNYHSVITSQLSQTCCSNDFAQSLASELNKSGLTMRLDNTGVFTDSASFMDLIPECTNISVGYFSEHTHSEMQNISFLERLANASINVDWSNLSIKRKVGLDPSISAKFGPLITKMKRQRIWSPKKVFTDEGNMFISLSVDEQPVLTVKRELETYKRLFDESGVQPEIVFDNGKINFKFN